VYWQKIFQTMQSTTDEKTSPVKKGSPAAQKFKKPARKLKRPTKRKRRKSGEVENPSPPKKRKNQNGKARLVLSRKTLAEARKLLLILDIDFTLVHTIQGKKYSQFADKYPEIHVYDKPDIERHLVKLRPYAREFLKEMSEKFFIAFYTNGDQAYAEFAAQLLDPDGKYIQAGVFGNPEEKAVEKFLEFQKHEDVPQHLCTIVDDRLDIWKQSQRNSVSKIEPFFFWNEESDEPRVYEDAIQDTELLKMRDILLRIHREQLMWDPSIA